jgi:hypothetical protein
MTIMEQAMKKAGFKPDLEKKETKKHEKGESKKKEKKEDMGEDKPTKHSLKDYMKKAKY